MIDVVDKDTKQILDSYEVALTGNHGQIMLEDLEKTFLYPNIADEEDDRLDHIPHEFRVWIREGERNVIIKMKSAITLNRDTELESDDDKTD